MRRTPLFILLMLLSPCVFAQAEAADGEASLPVSAGEPVQGFGVFPDVTEVLGRLSAQAIWSAVLPLERVGESTIAAAAETHGETRDDPAAEVEVLVRPGGLVDSALMTQTWKFFDSLGKGMLLASALDGAAVPGEELEARAEENTGPAYSVRDKALRMVRETQGGLAR